MRKLSTATTSQSRARSRSQRCEPRNPAPPVTTARGISGRRPGRRSRAGASPRDRAGCGRRPARAARAIASATRPKSSQRNSSHSVSTASSDRTGARVVRDRRPPRARELRRGGLARGRVVGPDRRAPSSSSRRHDDQRRRVAQVVGVGLEREAPHADRHARRATRRPRRAASRSCARAGAGSPRPRRAAG